MRGVLTEDARAVLAGAKQEARLRHQAIGTPHLLMALLADVRARPAQVLCTMGYSVPEVRFEAARTIGTRKDRPNKRFRPSLSPRVEIVIDLALGEARAAGRERADAEDLLFGLLADPNGKAARLLARMRKPGHEPATVTA
jgi:ATP-dependent Clp protease ATP-binding subunit ClpC